jgi:NTP pyrophosphatase (non-canonical NTP hydrolase)
MFRRSLQIAEEDGDPETSYWALSNRAYLIGLRGEVEEALTMAQRTSEATERLGDVFSRTLSLVNLAAIELMAGEPETALETIESAERVYLEAMPDGGEMEAWRASIRAEALIAVGREEEALEVAERAAREAREHRLHWTLPLALRSLAKARAATGEDGVAEALDEGEAVARACGCEMVLTQLGREREALATAG